MGRGLRERLAETGAEHARLAAALRALIDASVATDAPASALAEAATAVQQALAMLAPHVPTVRPPRFPNAVDVESPNDLMPFDPVIGRLSPIAPPIAFTWEDGRSVGRVRFGATYEGPPGCVHGGVIAAVFDQVLSIANLMSATPGPTVRLAIHYRKPTPLDASLVFEGWQERVEGRRVHTRGHLRHGDVVTAEAEGVFALVPVDRIMKLFSP